MRPPRTVGTTAVTGGPDAQSFDEGYLALEGSPEAKRLWGIERDPSLSPRVEPYSFVTQGALEEVAGLVRRNGQSGGMIIDLGCGSGGPGLEVASMVGVPLLGVDFSSVAVGLARRRGVERFAAGVSMGAVQADMHAVPLATSAASIVVSFDAVTFSESPGALAAEVLRLLLPGGVFVFTAWQARTANDERLPPRLRVDHARVLISAGFADVQMHDRPAWMEQEVAMLHEAERRFGSAGRRDEAMRRLLGEANAWLPVSDRAIRVLVQATRPVRCGKRTIRAAQPLEGGS